MQIEALRRSFARFARPRIDRLAGLPFVRLVRHFLARLVRGGADSPSMELDLGVGGLLALLGVPGLFAAMLMADHYSSFLNWARGRLHQDIFVVSIADKYLFICVAMAVTGLVTVLKWDKILPDSQDYLNLAPLPIRPRTVLLANAAAIAIAVVVLAIDVSAASTVLFPALATASAEASLGVYAAFAAAHALCLTLACLFTFCAVFALLGVLSAALPRDAFRAIASWVRGAIMLALIVLLLSGFLGASLVRQFQLAPSSAWRWLPSLWYLALYQDLQRRAGYALAGLAPMAWLGAAAALALTAASYALSYRRRFTGVLEGGRQPSQQPLIALAVWLVDCFAPRKPGFGRACHRFATRALFRGESHRVVIAVSVGLGWILAFQALSSAPAASNGAPQYALLLAPLMVAYTSILGLRVAFDLPPSVPSNWIFRAVLDPRANVTMGVARRLAAGFATLFVLLPIFALSWPARGPGFAALHTAYVLAFLLVLIELQFSGYRKIPLACPRPEFHEHLVAMCLAQLLGFFAFTWAGASLEQALLGQPMLFLTVPTAMSGVWLWKVQRRRLAREAGEWEEGLTFDNATFRTVEKLNLSDGL
jgi:hypothetical protein